MSQSHKRGQALHRDWKSGIQATPLDAVWRIKCLQKEGHQQGQDAVLEGNQLRRPSSHSWG